MSYVQHIGHESGYGSSMGGYPSAVPPPPGFFRDGLGPPPPPPPSTFHPGYQSYFDEGYPPPPPQHIGHQPWGWGYRDDYLCSSFVNTCLATLCCCCFLDQCCPRWY